jgi:hypothetical protein
MAGTLVKSVMLKIVSNDGDTESKLDLITKKADELGRLHPDIKVKIDSAAASAKLGVLRQELKDTTKAEKDTGDQSATLKSRLAGLAGGMNSFATGGLSGGGAAGGMTMAQKAMLGLNVATGLGEPLVAGLTVAVGGLGAGLVSAELGAGIFGLVTKSAFSQVTAANTAGKKLTGGLGEMQSSLKSATGEWNGFVKAASPGVASVIAQGFGLIPKALALMKPFLAPVETALHGIIADISHGMDSSGFKSFMGTMAKDSGPMLTGLAHAIGDIVVGLGGILRAFMPVSHSIMGGLDGITAKFAKWGTTLGSHSGFQSLMATFKTETPLAVNVLKQLGGVIKTVVASMTGLSTFSNSKMLLQMALPVLQLLNSLLKANPQLVRLGLYMLAAKDVASKMAPAFAGVATGIKGVKAGASAFQDLSSGFSNTSAAASDASGVWGTFGGKLSTAITAVKSWGIWSKLAGAATKVWTGIQAAFDLVMDANPIALVVIGIAALIAIIVICVIKFKAFREFWIGLWKDVKSFLGDAVSWIKSHWELLPLIFMGPIGIVVALVKSHFTQIKSIAMSVINDVVGFFRALPGRVISAIAGLGGMLFRAGQNVMRSLISGLTSMIGAVGSSVAGIAGKVAGFFGLSPAKEGPLSGAGAPEVRGAHFSHAFAAGVSSGAGRVAGAAARVAGAAAATAAGGAAAGGGGGGRNELVLTFAEGPFRTAFKASIRNHGGNPLVIGN